MTGVGACLARPDLAVPAARLLAGPADSAMGGDFRDGLPPEAGHAIPRISPRFPTCAAVLTWVKAAALASWQGLPCRMNGG